MPAPPASPSRPGAAGPGYEIVDPAFLYTDNCATRVAPFGPTPSPEVGQPPISRVLFGQESGAAYQIEVPNDWNGDLVIWAHGFNGNGPLLCAGVPNLRQHYIDNGYAWATSSYETNGYDVGQGVQDSYELLSIFRRQVERPDRVYMTGASMGGHVTAVAIERYRGSFDGAMPVCGALGDKELFDYFLDANVTAAALAGAPKPPFPVEPQAYATYVNTEVVPVLGVNPQPGTLVPSSPAGMAWGAAVEQRSGGTRPGFASAFGFWNAFGFGELPQIPFLFGLYPGTTDGTIGIARGNVTDNTATVYQLDGDPELTPAEHALNASVLRVEADPQGRPRPSLNGIPEVRGRIDIPVMTLHNLGDLFVPFSMEQVYAERVAENGDPDLLTQRAIRGTVHCDFTQEELSTAFDDLVQHVETGEKPSGDDVLDPAAVADPRYGCAFTRGSHPFFAAPAC